MITATQVGILHSVQVGSPHRYGTKGAAQVLDRAWDTSFFRAASPEPRWLHTTHLAGNEQADKKNHGRPDQAVLLYAAAHYPLWREETGRADPGPGGFAENFTIDGLSEETACVGDTYAIGAARIRVTGPRYPCWKIERRWGIAGLTDRVAATGRTGWYCCVTREGLIEPGAPVLLVERPYPQWSMALVNDFGHARNCDVALAREMADCPLLSDFWRQLVVQRATQRNA